MSLPKAISRILSKVLPIPKEYEKPVLFLRSHPFTFFPDVALFILLCVIPVIGYYFAPDTVARFWDTESGHALMVMGLSAWYLFATLLFFTNFVDYFLDAWIVTNERVIDIKQKGLFMRIINEARLYRVQNVRIEIKGVFQTLFHYGDVIIETAGETGQLNFHNVPDPDAVARLVLELAQTDREYHAEKIKLENLSDKARIVDEGA